MAKNKKKGRNLITYQSEFAMPLSYIFKRESGRLSVDVDISKKEMERKAKKELRKSMLKVIQLKFVEVDSSNISHGFAYFNVKVKGSRKQIEKAGLYIAEDD